MRHYLIFILLLIGCRSQVKVPPTPEIAHLKKEKQTEQKAATCSIEDTGFIAKELKSSYERYNSKDGILLYCSPTEHSSEADTLHTITRLDILEHGKVDSIEWCKVRTFKFPQKSGWIKRSDFAKDVIKVDSRRTIVGRTFPPPNQYYDGHAEAYCLVNGVIRDTLTFTHINGDHMSLSLIRQQDLDGIDALLRYESIQIATTEDYYQDVFALKGSKFIPFLFSDKSIKAGPTADTDEYTFYFPYFLSDQELILAPMMEHRGRLSEKEMRSKQFHFTQDISIPKEQCVVKFHEVADYKGKLKYRSTEVYHWNGADLARMFGFDFNYEEQKFTDPKEE